MPLSTKILLFLLPLTLGLSAQNPHPYFRNYTTDDGLPSPEVHYCIQDTAGYMWFATDNGVSRFDGYEFKNYGAQEGLKHPVVFYMQKDPQGKIWMATMHGHLYYIEKDSIIAFAQNDTIEKINSKPYTIIDFYIDSDGTKYLSTSVVGILKFTRDGKYQQINPSRLDISSKIFLKLGNRWILGGQKVPSSLRKPYWNENLKFFNIQPQEVLADSSYFRLWTKSRPIKIGKTVA